MAALDSSRFAKFVQFVAGCHVWRGAKSGKDYGVYGVAGRQVYAHRYSYEQSKGEIPPGYVIDHLCRNHPCVNPDHLEAVTPGENIRRGILPSLIRETKAKIQRCPAGHEYTPENTRAYNGKRHCKACSANASLAYASRNREKRMLASRDYRKRLKLSAVDQVENCSNN